MAEIVWIRFRGVSRSTTTTTTAAIMTPTKTTYGLASWFSPTICASPDAQAGDDQHEDGPDQDQEHGKRPLPT